MGNETSVLLLLYSLEQLEGVMNTGKGQFCYSANIYSPLPTRAGAATEPNGPNEITFKDQVHKQVEKGVGPFVENECTADLNVAIQRPVAC